MKKGVLLINLGTPNKPTTGAVRHYLREFLMDTRVIDLPAWLRGILVYGFILPFRPKQSAHAYQAIWTKQGSPLRTISEQCQQQLQQHLGNEYYVELGMRYGNPSIESALKKLQQNPIEQILVLPLFPQYSSAATGSAIEKTLSLLKKQANIPSIKIIHQFYQHPEFIKAYSQHIQSFHGNTGFVLFSYHGLPERQIIKNNDCIKNTCDLKQHCPPINHNNHGCYRAQCYETSRLLANALQLKTNQYQTSFQSRLGRLPWIKPYTDEILSQLYHQGIRNLTVISPSFVCDCLETLEEIGIRAKQQWLNLGGKEFTLIPSLNTQSAWIAALGNIIKEL